MEHHEHRSRGNCSYIDQGLDSKELSSQHPGGLCTACTELDLISLTEETCPHDTLDFHIHLGSLEDISRKQFCPSCRLILAAAKSTNQDIIEADDTAISIRRRFIWAATRGEMLESETAKFETPIFDISVLSMESFLEVVLGAVDGMPQYHEGGVAGTILRSENSTRSSTSSTQTWPQHEYRIRGRIMAPGINVDLLRNWMQSCDSQHDKCRLETPDIAEHKIRLVDVEGERVVSASLAEDYVALSYVWGPNTVPLLTRGTLPQYTALRGLRCSAIPRTISDAIEVVKAIGKRYLWVDSLCILQDDARDKQQQLPIMDRIYSHANLVIIAAAGHDAHSGLPGVGKTERRMLQHSDTVDGIDFVTAQPGVKQALEWTTWSSRGWTYQEAMLARRALIFTDTVVYWNCRDAIWREDMTGESLGQDFKHLLSANNSIWGHFADQYMKAVCRTAVYSQHVAEFSTRSFKDECDVLWAFLGILKLQAPRFQEGFIWGLPYERLDATLLWSENVQCRGVHQRDAHHAMVHGSRSYDIPYPSWSWLSTNTRVSFMHPCGDSVISRVIWHEPYKLGDNDETSATWLKSVTTPKNNTADAGHQSPSTDWLSGVDGMDFGLLNFTAQTARLIVKIDQDSSTSLPETDIDGEVPGSKSSGHGRVSGVLKKMLGHFAAWARFLLCLKEEQSSEEDQGWDRATVYTPDGAPIAAITVPVSYFMGKPERLGEFVVISSNAETKPDENCKETLGGLDCGTIKHIDGCCHVQSHNIMLVEWEEGIAYRRGLGTVGIDAWLDIKTKEKRIVLG